MKVKENLRTVFMLLLFIIRGITAKNFIFYGYLNAKSPRRSTVRSTSFIIIEQEIKI